MNRSILAISICIPLLGCEFQQNSKPYEFKDSEQESSTAPETRSTEQKPSAVTRPASTPSSPSKARQDPDKSFAEVDEKVVKGTPRHDFIELTFPE